MKENQLIMDIALATVILGFDIDRKEREGFTDLINEKHAFLRLHHFLVCANPPALEGARAADFKPNFLPCHKRPLSPDLMPCLHPEDECHCARILGCKLSEVDNSLIFYPDTIILSGSKKPTDYIPFSTPKVVSDVFWEDIESSINKTRKE